MPKFEAVYLSSAKNSLYVNKPSFLEINIENVNKPFSWMSFKDINLDNDFRENEKTFSVTTSALLSYREASKHYVIFYKQQVFLIYQYEDGEIILFSPKDKSFLASSLAKKHLLMKTNDSKKLISEDK